MTREQELKLIEIGLNHILHGYEKGAELIREVKKTKKKNPRAHKWTEEQRRKFKKSMAKIWAKKRNGK